MTKPDEIASFSQFSVVSHMFCMPKTLWLDLFGRFYALRIVGSSYDVPGEWNNCDVVDL